MADRWHEMWAAVTATRSTLDRVSAARAHDARCTAECGRCSVCIRRAAVLRNRERYGADDYPGGRVPWAR
jgi:hypothetical protein